MVVIVQCEFSICLQTHLKVTIRAVDRARRLLAFRNKTRVLGECCGAGLESRELMG